MPVIIDLDQYKKQHTSSSAGYPSIPASRQRELDRMLSEMNEGDLFVQDGQLRMKTKAGSTTKVPPAMIQKANKGGLSPESMVAANSSYQRNGGAGNLPDIPQNLLSKSGGKISSTAGKPAPGGKSTVTTDPVQNKGGTGAGGGGSTFDQYLQSFKDAQESARQANENRYSQVNQMYGQRLQKGLHEYDWLANDQKKRYGAMNRTLEGMGKAEEADIRESWRSTGASQQQALQGRGLGGTTVASTMRSGINRQQNADVGRLDERVRGQRLGLMGSEASAMERTQLGRMGYEDAVRQQQQGFIERREDVGPDPRLLASVSQGYGQGRGAMMGAGTQTSVYRTNNASRMNQPTTSTIRTQPVQTTQTAQPKVTTPTVKPKVTNPPTTSKKKGGSTNWGYITGPQGTYHIPQGGGEVQAGLPNTPPPAPYVYAGGLYAGAKGGSNMPMAYNRGGPGNGNPSGPPPMTKRGGGSGTDPFSLMDSIGDGTHPGWAKLKAAQDKWRASLTPEQRKMEKRMREALSAKPRGVGPHATVHISLDPNFEDEYYRVMRGAPPRSSLSGKVGKAKAR
jgi:hypothetical protein